MSIELISIIIAAVSAWLGWLFGIRNERDTQRQYQLDSMSFASSWYADLRAWASEVIDLLAEAAERCGSPQSIDFQKDESIVACRYRLSALIDRGRFFLPNIAHREHGLHKPEAYRGFRHPALNYLIGAYQILDGKVSAEEMDSSQKEALIRLKRQFVSSIQVILDPRLHTQEIRRLIEDSRAEEIEKESPMNELLSTLIPSKHQPQ